ncbi:hypothetical protein GCM10010518_11260 [Kitasatospora cinereorecta]
MRRSGLCPHGEGDLKRGCSARPDEVGSRRDVPGRIDENDAPGTDLSSREAGHTPSALTESAPRGCSASKDG